MFSFWFLALSFLFLPSTSSCLLTFTTSQKEDELSRKTEVREVRERERGERNGPPMIVAPVIRRRREAFLFFIVQSFLLFFVEEATFSSCLTSSRGYNFAVDQYHFSSHFGMMYRVEFSHFSSFPSLILSSSCVRIFLQGVFVSYSSSSQSFQD